MAAYIPGGRDQRRDPRTQNSLPVSIIIGTQVTVQGQLRDVSLKSAFIRIRSSVFIDVNDEVSFAIQCSADKDDVIQGQACIARLEKGEGFGMYFTQMDEGSLQRLKKLVEKP